MCISAEGPTHIVHDLQPPDWYNASLLIRDRDAQIGCAFRGSIVFGSHTARVGEARDDLDFGCPDETAGIVLAANSGEMHD
jgi:hypothetical protein